MRKAKLNIHKAKLNIHKIALLLTILIFLLPCAAFAEDVLLTAKIQNVTLARSKNGKQYVRAIINEERTLQGIAYEAGVAVFAFGNHVEKAKTLKSGQTLKAICDRRESKDGVSYIILKIVE
jgi:hypothetical protein